MSEDDTLSRVVASAEARGHVQHSDLYRWLLTRYRELSGILNRPRTPWSDIARELAAGDIRGGRGKPVTGHAVMKAWRRVCRDVASQSTDPALGPTAEPLRSRPTPFTVQDPLPPESMQERLCGRIGHPVQSGAEHERCPRTDEDPTPELVGNPPDKGQRPSGAVQMRPGALSPEDNVKRLRELVKSHARGGH